MTRLQEIAAEVEIYDRYATNLRDHVAQMKRDGALTSDAYTALIELKLVRDHTTVEHIKKLAERDVARAEAVVEALMRDEEAA